MGTHNDSFLIRKGETPYRSGPDSAGQVYYREKVRREELLRKALPKTRTFRVTARSRRLFAESVEWDEAVFRVEFRRGRFRIAGDYNWTFGGNYLEDELNGEISRSRIMQVRLGHHFKWKSKSLARFIRRLREVRNDRNPLYDQISQRLPVLPVWRQRWHTFRRCIDERYWRKRRESERWRDQLLGYYAEGDPTRICVRRNYRINLVKHEADRELNQALLGRWSVKKRGEKS